MDSWIAQILTSAVLRTAGCRQWNHRSLWDSPGKREEQGRPWLEDGIAWSITLIAFVSLAAPERPDGAGGGARNLSLCKRSEVIWRYAGHADKQISLNMQQLIEGDHTHNQTHSQRRVFPWGEKDRLEQVLWRLKKPVSADTRAQTPDAILCSSCLLGACVTVAVRSEVVKTDAQ